MVSLNAPAERDYQSVEAHLHNRKPVADEEWGYIYQKEDLVTLRDGREMAVLDSMTERLLRTFHCSLLHVSHYTNYLSERKKLISSSSETIHNQGNLT
jgi:hypothetical protein